MSLKLGTTDINKIYLGSTEIKKAYLGATLVYDKTVPADFQLNAISFNGTDESMANTTAQTIGISNTHSCEIWFKRNNVNDGYLFVLRNYNIDINNLIQINCLNNGKIRIDLYNSSGTRFKRYETSTVYSTSTIGSIGYTWDGTNLDIYTNGTIDNSVNKIEDNSGTMTDSVRKTYIGSNVGVNSFFRGEISKCSIWNSKLTSSEFSSLYNSGNGYKLDLRNSFINYTSNGNLKHQWALGKDTGSNIGADYVNSGNINVSDNSLNINDSDIVTF